MTALARNASVLTLKSRDDLRIGSMYAAFFLITMVGMRFFSDLGYSSILTLGAAVQTFGFYHLRETARRNKSLAGISMRTCELYMVMLVTRLISTLCRNGYLPVDSSGDCVYQLCDLASLFLVTQLRLMFEDPVLRGTYQEECDSMNVSSLVPGCLILAIFIHGDLNDSFFFDSIWTFSMNIDTVAMLPQLWMLAKIGGEVKGMTAHFVVAIILSRACAFSFWIHGHREIGHTRRRMGPNIAGGQLLLAHLLQLLLSADFAYYYVVAWWSGEMMQLPLQEF